MLELEVQKLQLQIEYERLWQTRTSAERLNGSLPSTGSERGDQRRMGFDSIEQCAKVLKGFRLPCDADVPLWFEEVEKLFATYRVPYESRVHLVMPALTERVRYLLRNLNQEESTDYESVKEAVLMELKLSPAEYLQRFERAVKRKEETWSQFASRVKTYFSYYLQVRGAATVDVMAELMVADRIKSGLSIEGLEYVRLREDEGWLRPPEIARVLQTFEQAKGKGYASKLSAVVMGQKPTRGEKGGLKCYICHGSGHFAKDCPKSGEQEKQSKKVIEPRQRAQKVAIAHETGSEMPDGVLTAKVKVLKHKEGMTKLQLIPIACGDVSTDAILDTGSEITVMRESLLPQSLVEPSGTIRLVSAFGKTIEAKLVTLPLKLNTPQIAAEPQHVDLLCALTNELVEGTDCLLTKEDWEHLLKASSSLTSLGVPAEPAQGVELSNQEAEVVAGIVTLEEEGVFGEVQLADQERDESLGQREEFRAVQLADATLKKGWEYARSGKSGMFVSDGLLHHRDSILGTRVLEKAGLKASPEKCQVAQSHIHYLGHIVGSGTHAPDPEKIAAIRNLVPPRTKKELRSLLGLCGYYREYVREYAEVASPLTRLTKKAVPNRIPWPEEGSDRI
ncbi:uncharacterized protein LOC125939822 [Dermacentor silvarum]|uniref:uncharacterized protein LOC125939822 n=1 Tax=Dermacentor silvarum TaxID=543639 RepID=UPI002100B506|nr:uncharacterized protein LOC125939822 [Dermacentor silvarum]